MHVLTQHFKALLKAVNPPKQLAKLAKGMPAIVREHLEQSDDLETKEPHTRLVGSYARNTAVEEIKDVDLIVCVDGEYGSGRPSAVLGVLRDVLSNLPGSTKTELRSQRRSVRGEFEHAEFFLDVVPGILPHGVEFPLYVPDRVQEEWILSDPIRYGEHLSQLNSAHGNKVVPLIKLVKHWRDVQMKYKKPKSYWLESKVVELFEGRIGTDEKSYAELFGETGRATYSDFEYIWRFSNRVPTILDPMLGNSIAAKWSRDYFESFMNHLQQCADWCDEALAEEDKEKCIALWCKVFGDEFAEALKREAAEKAELSKTGKLLVTGSGRVHTGERRERSVRVPRHDFYGD